MKGRKSRIGSSIQTPLGKVQVFRDGQTVNGVISAVQNNSFHPKSANRYLFEIQIKPDQKKHVLLCRLIPSQLVRSYFDTGERCEGVIYHNEDESVFVLIGAEGNDDSPYYDYWLNVEEENELHCISYQLCSDTTTSSYRFGVMFAELNPDDEYELSCYDADPAYIIIKRESNYDT